ncbi:AAA family ATPase [Pseudomonas aeruginosa]
MEVLEVNDFLTVRKARFEVKKINIIIGPQARGKSVIAKLLYFFKSSFAEQYVKALQNLSSKRDLDKECIAQFEQIFPKYTWGSKSFSVGYYCDDYWIFLEGVSNSRGHALKIKYCKKLVNLYSRLRSSYKTAIADYEEKVRSSTSIRRGAGREQIFWDAALERLSSSSFSDSFQRSIFIPASRSFFANLQKNVFSFLASNIEIDPFLKDFGSKYETCKRFYGKGGFYQKPRAEYSKTIERLVKDIAVGEYVYDDEKDWIQYEGKKTNLANASSGQQESVPMLLVLSIWPVLLRERPGTFIIEEPEAHLFPISQKHIVTLISNIYGEYGHRFLITTHSPYVLTAVNNLIAAGDAYKKVRSGSAAEKKLNKIYSRLEAVSFDDVSAYTIESGELVSIVDEENRLIGGSVLDGVSDYFESSFDDIARILYGEGDV